MTLLSTLTTVQKRSHWIWLPIAQVIAASVTVLLLVIALARPQTELVTTDMTKKGIDIVLALDVSGSMMAEDLRPNRMEAAKESLLLFLENRKDDRLGVVVFAGKAFTQTPLTFDGEILREYLNQTTTETIDQRVRGLSGTAVGDAILAGVKRLSSEEERTKVLIVATDGDANVGVDPILAAQKAADEGVRIYTIGIGSEEGALIPATNALGQKTYLTDEQGQLILAVFNEASLREIAEIGGGKYFQAGNTNEFKEVLSQIDALEKTEAVVKTTTDYQDAHQPWLWAAALSVMAWTLLLSVKPIVR
jgi:Ca-activated chloride channel family protein